MRHLCADNLSNYAFVNLDTIQKPIRGIVVNCHGFTDETTYSSSPRPGVDLGREGILYVFPYYSPWAWASDHAFAYIDEVLDVVWEMLDLPSDLPFLIAGGSMGGMTAMLYTLFGKRRVCAVACNCPVCDLRAILDNNPHVQRSVYYAYLDTERTIEEEIDRHNPILHVSEMPDIPYLMVSGQADLAVPEDRHAHPIKQAMEQAGKQAQFISVPAMTHCDLQSHEEYYLKYLDFCLTQLGKN